MERLLNRDLVTDESIVIVDIDDVLNKLGAELYIVMDAALGVIGNPNEYDFSIRYPNHSINTLWFEILPQRFWDDVTNFLPNTLDQLVRLQAQFYPAKIVVCTARGKLSTEQGLDKLIADFEELTGDTKFTLAVCTYFESKLDCVAKEFPNNRIIGIVEDSPSTLQKALDMQIPNIIKSPRPYNTHLEIKDLWCHDSGILLGAGEWS